MGIGSESVKIKSQKLKRMIFRENFTTRNFLAIRYSGVLKTLHVHCVHHDFVHILSRVSMIFDHGMSVKCHYHCLIPPSMERVWPISMPEHVYSVIRCGFIKISNQPSSLAGQTTRFSVCAQTVWSTRLCNPPCCGG